MARTLTETLAKLPEQRQKKIHLRAKTLANLRELRLARQFTQQEMAAILEIGQDSISRLENRDDMRLSTLRAYVEALGGKLEITACFPGQEPVRLDEMPHRKS